MHRILVTRPEPLASRTAERLVEAGYEPLVLPLSRTLRLQPVPSGIPRQPRAVAVTSAAAIRNAPKELLRSLVGVPCFAVGPATAALARNAGFESVAEGPGDAPGLARLLVAGGQAPILYLAGRVRRPEFEAQLASAGIDVATVETYDTVSLLPATDHVASLLDGNGPDAALVYSATAAEALQELADRHQLASLLAKTAFCCLSPRIAERFEREWGRKIRVAAEPTEEALLSLLSSSG
jgi:uroporphyrinogen-III synthase